MDIGEKFRKKKLTDIGLSLAFQRSVGLFGFIRIFGYD